MSAASNTWSAAQYLKFEDERSRPARDLLARVSLGDAGRIVDLGCGPGNSTEILAKRYPVSVITGVDTSADMLAAARKRLPRATFVEADAATWMPDAPPDLIFANALFQWVPDHLAVLARLIGGLAPGGILALQVPDNLGEPSHVIMREVAGRDYPDQFAKPIAREEIPPAEAYYDCLMPYSARVDVWRTAYHHTLADPSAIVEWVKGTGLRPYLDRLAPEDRPGFLAAYEAALILTYLPRADGTVLFRFPRLFVVAQKAV